MLWVLRWHKDFMFRCPKARCHLSQVRATSTWSVGLAKWSRYNLDILSPMAKSVPFCEWSSTLSPLKIAIYPASVSRETEIRLNGANGQWSMSCNTHTRIELPRAKDSGTLPRPEENVSLMPEILWGGSRCTRKSCSCCVLSNDYIQNLRSNHLAAGTVQESDPGPKTWSLHHHWHPNHFEQHLLKNFSLFPFSTCFYPSPSSSSFPSSPSLC